MLDKVRKAWEQIEKQQSFPHNSQWIVGVSGGPDSLALLHSLSQILLPKQLVVAHLNHGWRPEATAEALFVQEAAVAWGMTCHLGQVDVPALAETERLSLEDAGRQARHHFFADVARKAGAQGILVGHHADDQAETVLLNVLRGTGLTGLRGMQWVAPVPGAPDLFLIRPLLECTRLQIMAYCQTHDLQPIQDPSNADTIFIRNQLRHEVLPTLRTINPQIDRHLSQMATILAADEAFLTDLVATQWAKLVVAAGVGWLELDLNGWREQHLSLRRRLLRQVVGVLKPEMIDVEMTFAGIEAARQILETGTTGDQAALPGRVKVEIEYGRMHITAVDVEFPRFGPQLMSDPQLLPIPGQMMLPGGWQLSADWWEETTKLDYQTNVEPWQAFVAVSSPVDSFVVRSRLPGERWQPLGMNGHSVKLKETMIDRKIPATQRAHWPLVANEIHLVWLVGHQIDERVKITAVSDRIVWLRCQRQADYS